MSSAEHDAAAKVLADAQAALAAVDKAAAAPVTEVAHTKFVDLGPEYLGPVAVNGG